MKKNIDTKELLDFISQNGGTEYIAAKRLSDPSEIEKYQALYSKTKRMMAEFSALVDALGEATDMASFIHSNPLDGSCRRIKSYFWGELRQVRYISLPESISLFLEKTKDGSCFRVSLELDTLHSSKEDLQNHNRILEHPLTDDCIYAVNNSGVRDLIYTHSKDEVKELMETKGFKKVQVCTFINSNTGEELFTELVDAVSRIKPYYDFVIKGIR